MYEVFVKLLESSGYRVSDVAKATGIRPSVFSDWKKGRYTLKADKLQKIADFFGVQVDYLMTGKDDNEPYYLNDDVRELAEFIFHNPEYKVLFDASRKVQKKDIEFVAEMIKRTQG